MVKGVVAAVVFAVLMAVPPLLRRLRRDDALRARPGDNGLD